MSVDPGPFALGPVGGRGPAVLCLHGLTGTPYEVRPPAEALAAEGFACVGPLLPGHGLPAEALAATEERAWLDSARSEFDRLGATHDRVYVLGLSMGGLLALALGACRSVAGLVVMATPLRLRLVERLAVPLLARVRDSLPRDPAIRDPEAKRHHPGTDRMPLAAAVRLLRLQRLVRDELPRVTAPIHLIFSRADPIVHPRNAQRILATVGSNRRSVRYLESSLHGLTVDIERAQVASDCVRFLRELETVGRSAALTADEGRPSIGPVRA